MQFFFEKLMFVHQLQGNIVYASIFKKGPPRWARTVVIVVNPFTLGGLIIGDT